jgi:hypothetical protein
VFNGLALLILKHITRLFVDVIVIGAIIIIYKKVVKEKLNTWPYRQLLIILIYKKNAYIRAINKWWYTRVSINKTLFEESIPYFKHIFEILFAFIKAIANLFLDLLKGEKNISRRFREIVRFYYDMLAGVRDGHDFTTRLIGFFSYIFWYSLILIIAFTINANLILLLANFNSFICLNADLVIVVSYYILLTSLLVWFLDDI